MVTDPPHANFALWQDPHICQTSLNIVITFELMMYFQIYIFLFRAYLWGGGIQSKFYLFSYSCLGINYIGICI